MKRENNRGITLISLIVTVIIMLILAGVVLSLTVGENGLFKTAKYAAQKNSETSAREKLSLALNDLEAHKYVDETYNENEYINSYLKNEGMQVTEDIVTVDNWKFKIDRSVPKISESLGQDDIRIAKVIREYLGRNENGKYTADTTITVESNKAIKSIVFQEEDGTRVEVTATDEKYKIAKDMILEFDKEYKIIINTSDGKSEERIIMEKLPNAGTLVAVPDNWMTNTPAKVKTPEGKEVESSKKIATVDAVVTADGEVVPVPKGFYYVGGKISTGVVISDNPQDQNKYKNDVDIPSGIEAVLNSDGTVKEIKNTLVGNQFVWIPCKEAEYVKTNWGQGNVTNKSNSCWDTSVDRLGELQTKKYGGFYVARFEAGLPDNIEETKDRQQNTGSNQTYNKTGRPQSKAGLVPWNYIDWNKSRENANSMYNTEYVNSGLITGTQWDVMINWMTDKNSTELTSSGTFGNYANVTPTITLGRTSYGFVSGSWYQDPFVNTWVKDTTRQAGTVGSKGYAWTTGASNDTRKKNLYDVGGNMWEWTEETSFYGGNSATQYRVFRGGSFTSASSTYPVCYRGGSDTVSYTGIGVGFRAVLYMK